LKERANFPRIPSANTRDASMGLERSSKKRGLADQTKGKGKDGGRIITRASAERKLEASSSSMKNKEKETRSGAPTWKEAMDRQRRKEKIGTEANVRKVPPSGS